MEITRRLITVILIHFCFGLSLSAATDIYRWVDEHGTVHFSDKPTDERAEKIGSENFPAVNIISGEDGTLPDTEPTSTFLPGINTVMAQLYL